MPHRVDAEPRFEERAARLEWRIDTTDRRLRELQERLERLKATSEYCSTGRAPSWHGPGEPGFAYSTEPA
jgi:hypothetical protein